MRRSALFLFVLSFVLGGCDGASDDPSAASDGSVPAVQPDAALITDPTRTPDLGGVPDSALAPGDFEMSDSAVEMSDSAVVPPPDSGGPIIAEHQPCVAKGLELGQCAAGLTCLVDALPPSIGACKRPCQSDGQCAVGQKCNLEFEVCATPAALGQTCDGFFQGGRLCFHDDPTVNVFPFCVEGTCQLVCDFPGSTAQAPCLAGQSCSTSLSNAPDFGSQVNICQQGVQPTGCMGAGLTQGTAGGVSPVIKSAVSRFNGQVGFVIYMFDVPSFSSWPPAQVAGNLMVTLLVGHITGPGVYWGTLGVAEWVDPTIKYNDLDISDMARIEILQYDPPQDPNAPCGGRLIGDVQATFGPAGFYAAFDVPVLLPNFPSS